MVELRQYFGQNDCNRARRLEAKNKALVKYIKGGNGCYGMCARYDAVALVKTDEIMDYNNVITCINNFIHFTPKYGRIIGYRCDSETEILRWLEIIQ